MVPVPACTASHALQHIGDLIDAPSAVFTMLIASLALPIAALRPLICEVMRVEIASPAASSLAELIFLPVESCSIAVFKLNVTHQSGLSHRRADVRVNYSHFNLLAEN